MILVPFWSPTTEQDERCAALVLASSLGPNTALRRPEPRGVRDDRLANNLAEEGFDWAHRFDDTVRDIMTSAPGDLARVAEHPDVTKAVPTPDHFLPVAYIAGLAAATGEPAELLFQSYAYGSLSMTSYVVPAAA